MTVPSLVQPQRPLILDAYLEELAVLTGRLVRADELDGVEQVDRMRQVAQWFVPVPKASCEIAFADRLSPRFDSFIRRLRDSNSSPIYVWTPRTLARGALLVPAIDHINFGFAAGLNDEGMLSFATCDGEDRLLLDFEMTSTAAQTMHIEVRGPNWGKVAY